MFSFVNSHPFSNGDGEYALTAGKLCSLSHLNFTVFSVGPYLHDNQSHHKLGHGRSGGDDLRQAFQKDANIRMRVCRFHNYGSMIRTRVLTHGAGTGRYGGNKSATATSR